MTAAQRSGAGSAGDLGPFVPGQGQIPPHLAGREHEQELIRHLLRWLETKRPPERDLILYGPRGNGKTALMEWALIEARASGIGTLKFTGADIESKEWLARHLSVVPPRLRLLSGVSLFGIGIRTRDSPVGLLSEVLSRRARRRALVVAVDEAHTLAIDTGRAIPNAVQRSRTDQAPVVLLLAGTPDLPRHVNSMGASFWGRSETLPLGLLQPEAAADAIRIPLEAEGRSISAEALAQVVEESHGYSYFLQLWGRLIWTGMPNAARPVSLDDVGRARPGFENARNIHYLARYAELERARLSYVAASLSQAFIGHHKRTSRDVNEAIRLALESEGRDSGFETVLTVRDRLYDLGYILVCGR